MFHLTNFQLFNIGIFPWLMLLATPIFFDPKWLSPVLRIKNLFAKPMQSNAKLTTPDRHNRMVIALLALFVAFYILMPLRHHLYPGNVSWTEERLCYFSSGS